MTGRLGGRGVLVTGGGSGIGRVLAATYAREGARVVVAGRRAEPLEETAAEVRRAGGTCHAVQADVRGEEDCARLVRETLDRLGRLDVLVNNAGAPGTDMPVAEMTLANWHDTLATNLTGPMLLTREALRQAMIPAGGGNVQFCSSAAGMNVRPKKAHYAVAKLGLVAGTTYGSGEDFAFTNRFLLEPPTSGLRAVTRIELSGNSDLTSYYAGRAA